MKSSWSRREFIRVASLAAGAFTLKGCGSPAATPVCDPLVEGVCLPTLGGAPATPDGYVIAAFVDTIVPGAHRDPEGAPGGIDVGAPGMFFDPELPAAELTSLLVTLLDGTSRRVMNGANFNEIEPEDRELVVEEAIASFSPMEFVVQLAKLAYFSKVETHAHLGYPGANDGYIGDPDLSFGVAMATELTKDGNMP